MSKTFEDIFKLMKSRFQTSLTHAASPLVNLKIATRKINQSNCWKFKNNFMALILYMGRMIFSNVYIQD
jgi:hypothetical protein